VNNSPDGAAWRAFDYISGTQTIEQVSNPEQAFALGAAIGEFQNMLSDLSTSLHETIPDFHETLKRFEAFHQALLSAPPERLQMASAEVRFAETRRELCTRLVQPQEKGLLPRRITHNDTKINNLLFDAGTGEALCVIDLDTVMPGLTLYDFGDMVRTGTPTRPEDHAETRGIRVDLDRFASLAQGYLSTAGPFLNGTERSLLVFAGRLLTYETGLRFLTDYLAGDVYFRIHYAGQNLDRARNQFRLLEDMEVKADRMEAILFAVWERLIS